MANREDNTKIDIVIPVYNEGEFIYNNILSIKSVLDKENISHRFILVSDGSKDKSWEEIKRLKKDINNVSGINLSRNFGKESALCAGIMQVNADLCIVMDSDLQHPPEMIPEMLIKQKEGYNIVECVKSDRGNESLFNKIAANIFYKMINKFSGFDMDNASDFKLIDKQAIDAWKEIGDVNTFFRGMMEWVGFEKAKISFNVQERNGGTTKFSTYKLVKLALNALTSFSPAPLYLTNFLSASFFVGALILGIQTLYNKITGVAASGFSTVILLILILGAAILFCLGIIGTYISKIYDEVKNRPRYIIKDKI